MLLNVLQMKQICCNGFEIIYMLGSGGPCL